MPEVQSSIRHIGKEGSSIWNSSPNKTAAPKSRQLAGVQLKIADNDGSEK
jgi:hypothetical protein